MGAFVALLTPGPVSTLFALTILPGTAALYGAAAILQVEYSFAKSWRPSWGQCLALAWVGGWLLIAAGNVIRALRAGGTSTFGESIGGWALVLGLFVALPWGLASLRARSRRATQ
jgi:hypothetical protein